MHTVLPDPRVYSSAQQVSLLHTEVDHWLQNGSAAAAIRLSGLLQDILQCNDDATTHAAHSAAPSWRHQHALDNALDNLLLPRAGAAQLRLFVLPLVWIVGSQTGQTITSALPADAIRHLLQDHGVLAADNHVWLATELIDLAGLQTVNMSQWFHAAWHLSDAAQGLPFSLAGAPIAVNGNEQVALRFLLGACWEGDARVRLLSQEVGRWSLALTQLLQKHYAAPDLTLFVLPRAMQSLMAGMQEGRMVLLDVRFQLFASRIIKTIREQVGDPIAILAAHLGDELRVTIRSKIQSKTRECFVWPLARHDDMADISQRLLSWLAEAQLDSVYVLPTVQPDLDPAGLPFFADLDDVDALSAVNLM